MVPKVEVGADDFLFLLDTGIFIDIDALDLLNRGCVIVFLKEHIELII